jgi:hypothetical protein
MTDPIQYLVLAAQRAGRAAFSSSGDATRLAVQLYESQDE